MTLEILLPDWIEIAILGVMLIVTVGMMFVSYPEESVIVFAFILFAGIVYVMMILVGAVPSDGIIPNMITWKIAGAP